MQRRYLQTPAICRRRQRDGGSEVLGGGGVDNRQADTVRGKLAYKIGDCPQPSRSRAPFSSSFSKRAEIS